MNKNQPIGIFDSGIGGLTVANAVSKHLPNEEIIYIGDTAHFPYGDKSTDAIRDYAKRITEFLLAKNCKLILIACNTASAAAYDFLKELLNEKVFLVNVIDPVVNKVVNNSTIKKIGIIATKGTISSGVYEQKLKNLKPNLEVGSLATQLLAPMIESGFYNNSVSQAIINSYLSYPDFQDIDGMILACTHYPLIKKEIDYFFHQRVEIFDSTDVTAMRVKEILTENNLLNDSGNFANQFYVTDLTTSFEQTTKIFYPGEIKLELCPIWNPSK